MTNNNEWWRSAVIYQIYPRSFADSDGDGYGDLVGITGKLDEMEYLGIDALWLSPFYPSPGNDAGYDVADYVDVDPMFGTLDDFDALVQGAHSRGIRVIVDLVPNHTSSEHRWFQEALASPEGSPERERYIFRDGKGDAGDEPPNNWKSVFGGPAWTRLTDEDGTPGQWYLHLFDPTQPDLNWDNPWVRQQFEDILRFWLDRGVDGFRVDVAHALDKVDGLPDWIVDVDNAGLVGEELECPYFGQPGSHEVYRRWNQVLGEYPGDRMLVAEAWVEPMSKLAAWVRSDEMNQAFNFSYLVTDWDAKHMKDVITESLEAFGAVGAPSTWVLSNHDTIRHATRLVIDPIPPHGSGVGAKSTGIGPEEQGLRRARAATALMLALPGSAYIYQGEELGLPEYVDMPDDLRQDPTFLNTGGERYGRDGCRIPLPWLASRPAFGFNSTGETWLPQPDGWGRFAHDAQQGVEGSTLEFYRKALALRKKYQLGTGELTWLDDCSDTIVAFRVGQVRVFTNYGDQPFSLPSGEILLCSSEDCPESMSELPGDTTVWMRA